MIRDGMIPRDGPKSTKVGLYALDATGRTKNLQTPRFKVPSFHFMPILHPTYGYAPFTAEAVPSNSEMRVR